MKSINVVALFLLVVGGLNWGLVRPYPMPRPQVFLLLFLSSRLCILKRCIIS
jgi:hypothetical protein